jgi:small subunit ribosomal protein S1
MAEEKNTSAENAEEQANPAIESNQDTPETPQPQAEPVAEQPEAPAEAAAAEETTADVEAQPEAQPVEETKQAEPSAQNTDEGDVDQDGDAQASDIHATLGQENIAPEKFDWERFEGGEEEYGKDERERLESVYGDTLSLIVEKEVTTGTVVSVNPKEVVINIGYKSEGVISASEFRYNPNLKPGDEVPVFIERQEDPNGQLIISHRTARIHSAWDNVNDAMEKDMIITGEVKCRTKGGLIVDVFGIEAFLPGSQIDVKPIRDYDQYVGKQMEFKVVKINQEFKNVVVSHKALIEAELEEQKKQIIGGLEKGQVLEGIVKNITSYGVFVDLGGVDGLIHITDLSWGRINHPEEVVTLDEKINVVILDFDDNKKRIALGLKQLSAHPWDALDENLNVGDKVKGNVVVIADYGAFVEIAPGVEGLIHVSEMSWSQHLRSAQDFIKVGDEVEAVVLTLDREDRKMSLGMKQLMPDPWEAIEAKYPVESRHKSTVRNFTNFGVFVELEEGIDGLIHISDLSWSKKVKHPSEFCNIGDELEVIVLELDKENRRLSLGHKQLEENPWDVFGDVFEVGTVHQGTIIRKEGSQAIVALPYGVEGYCAAKQLRKEDGSNLELEDTGDFVVLEFNKNAKRISLSHTRTFEDAPERKEKKATGGATRSGGSASGGSMSKAVKEVNEKAERTTLGDLGVLSQLKEQMEDTAEAPAKKKEQKPKAETPKEEADTSNEADTGADTDADEAKPTEE